MYGPQIMAEFYGKNHDGKPKKRCPRMTLPPSEMDTEKIPSKATLTDKPSTALDLYPNAHPMMALWTPHRTL